MDQGPGLICSLVVLLQEHKPVKPNGVQTSPYGPQQALTQCEEVHTFLFLLWFSSQLFDFSLLASAEAQRGEQKCRYLKKKKSSRRFSVDYSKKINTSHQCSRERPGFPFPQALSVFLINCQSLPLLPSHPDPQLPPLSVPLRLLRHPAAQLPLQPAGAGTRYFTAH